MKKLLAMLLLSTTLFGCNTEEEAPELTSFGYIGTMEMNPLKEPEKHDTVKDVEVNLLKGKNATLDLWILGMQFPGMPIKIDMTFPGIDYAMKNDTFIFHAGRLIPYYGSRPMENREVTSLSGKATEESLDFNFECMGYRVSYTGKKNK